MNSTTLFNAYRTARDEMLRAANNRGSTFGILASQDRNALQYQRYDRLARCIEYRFNGEAYCPNCAGRGGSHYSSCRVNERASQTSLHGTWDNDPTAGELAY